MIKHILNFFKKNYYFLSGLLIFLSFPTYNIWFMKGFAFFAWISLVPLFLYVRDKNFKEVVISSFITGFIGIYLVCRWIGNFGASVEGGFYVVLGFLIPSLTVFFTTKIVISELFSRRFEKFRIFIYPCVWIIIDYIQSIGFLAFPWTYWGYSQFPFTPFIQFASLTGIMGITFILILFNKILSENLYAYLQAGRNFKILLIKHAFRNLLLIIFTVLLITGAGYISLIVHKQSNIKDLKVSIVQTCISPWENWRQNRFKYLGYLDHFTRESLTQHPDLIIWSESATLEHISFHYANGNLNEFEQKVLDIAASSNTPLLTGEIGVTQDTIGKRYYPQNNAVLIDKDGRVVDTYSKINLVPFGEWFPYGKWFPFIRELLVRFGGSNFVPGDKLVLFNTSGKRFGVLICYEGIFYSLCREYKKSGIDFLVNITNDGWTNSYAGHIQHFSAAKFRAIENGIWFVRAGNTGLSALIDPYGRIIDTMPILEKGYFVSGMDFAQNHKTFYSEYGDLLLYASIIFIVLLSGIFLFKKIIIFKKQ